MEPVPASRADESLQGSFRRRLAQAAYVPLAAMLLFAIVMGMIVDRQMQRAEEVDRTHAIIAQANHCFLLAVDMQSGARGFLLAGSTNFLAPYLRARAASDADFNELKRLIIDPAQRTKAEAIHSQVNDYARFSQGLIDHRAAAGTPASLGQITESKARFDQIRESFAAFNDVEQRLLRERSNLLSRFSRAVVALRLTGAMILAALLAWFIRRQLRSVAQSYQTSLNETLRSEERYRQLAAELEARVTERTRELTQANERLKEVDRLKSEFLATMSHELRTPLNSIIGFNEIISAGLAGPVNAEQKKQLGMSLNSARHLLQLINDLLDLARIESGRHEMALDWFDIYEVTKQVLNTLQPLAANKNLLIETDISGEPNIFSDRKRVFQILLNLANNAVKFTERGKVTIVATNLPGVLTVTVRDTGIGIGADDQKRLFEAFRQVDGSARRRFEGTGLGLHLSRRLAQLLGGEISVESELGRGSAFTVKIPWRNP